MTLHDLHLKSVLHWRTVIPIPGLKQNHRSYLTQLLGPLLDFELLADLSPNVLLQFLQFVGQGLFRYIIRYESVLVTQLIENRMSNVVTL